MAILFGGRMAQPQQKVTRSTNKAESMQTKMEISIFCDFRIFF